MTEERERKSWSGLVASGGGGLRQWPGWFVHQKSLSAPEQGSGEMRPRELSGTLVCLRPPFSAT